MKIKIIKRSLDKQILIYMNDNKRDSIQVNMQNVNYSADRLAFKICDMVSNWPAEMVDVGTRDGKEYIISIKHKREERVYNFKNKFPDDIYRLDLVIDETLEAANGKQI